VAHDLARALDAARGDALRRGADAIAVIGGTELFELTMPLARRMALTWVHAKPEGDAYFPKIDPQVWREVERLSPPKGADDDYGITYVTYERAGAA
jgi:dihydrofolate reductase